MAGWPSPEAAGGEGAWRVQRGVACAVWRVQRGVCSVACAAWHVQRAS